MSLADRQARDLPLDAHLHTDLSPDIDVPIDTYARQAVERGIAEIAITDHVDFDPAAPAFDCAPFAQRERVVRGMNWLQKGFTESSVGAVLNLQPEGYKISPFVEMTATIVSF